MINYELRALEPTPSVLGDVSGPPLHFDETGQIDCSNEADLFIGNDPLTSSAREAFARRTRLAQGTPIGTWTLKDVHIFGSRGLLVDTHRRVIWYGAPIGWSLESVSREIQLLGGTVSGNTVRFTESTFEDDDSFDRLDSVNLITLPGYAVYGHWLIDILPRLLRPPVTRSNRQPAIYAPRPPHWATPFVESSGVRMPDRALARPGKLVRAQEVRFATLIKNAQVLDRHRAETAWSALRRWILKQPLDHTEIAGVGDRIYVSRSKWRLGMRDVKSPRALSNAPEVEALMRDHGYSVVHPQDLTLRAQVEVFSRARRVVGEDGSGLHNTIFSPADLHVTVLSTHRTNLFHASVVNVMRQHLSYLQSLQEGAGWVLPLDLLGDHIGKYA